MNKEKKPNQDFFPKLTPKERQNLKKYLELVKRIYDRLDEKEKQKLFLKLEWEKRNHGKKSAS